MTYNFDPDRWYEDQLARLEIEHRAGRLSEREYELALQDAERRYDKLIGRLDGAFDLSPGAVSRSRGE